MKFRFTKYSLMNALLSLIPIFPTWTLFPGVGAEVVVEKLTSNCEASYTIVLWIFIIFAITLTTVYLKRVDKILLKDEKSIRTNFRLVSLAIYTLINTIGLLLILGKHGVCHGGSDALLVCIFSGPIASIFLILFGFIVDLNVKSNIDKQG